MPGQAVVTIGAKTFQVELATTYLELTQGLGGVASIPSGTGMLFDTGITQAISVTTETMLFPLDIAFISEELVVTEIYRDVSPGYILEAELSARHFLEVNAGELEGVEVGDPVSVDVIIFQEPSWGEQLLGMFMGIFPLIIFGAFAIGMVKVLSNSNSPDKLSYKTTVFCPICDSEIGVPEYDKITRSEALRKHIEKEHPMGYGGHSIHGEPRRRLVEQYGSWAVGRAEAVCPEDDVACVTREAKRLIGTLKARYGEEAVKYVTIVDPGKTVFHSGDVISIVALEKENKRMRDIGEKEATYQVTQPKVIPVERYTKKKEHETPIEIEYFPDSPEFLAYTIVDIGYADKLENAFRERVSKVRNS